MSTVSSPVKNPTQRPWSPPTRLGRLVHVLAALLSSLVLALVARVQVRGRLPEGPVIVAGNHTSVFDPLVSTKVLHSQGRRLLMLGTGGLFDAPVVGRLLYAMGNIPVYRHSETRTESLRESARALRAGSALGLYPEGRITRNLDTSVEPLKTGIVRMSVETGVPIVCLIQWGTHQLVPLHHYVPSWRFFLRPQRIVVEIGGSLNMRELLGTEPTREDLRRGAVLLHTEMERLRCHAAGLPASPRS